MESHHEKIIAITVLALSMSNLAYADNLLQTAQQDGHFNTFLIAAKKAGLDSTLTGKGPIRVFAPNDASFAKLPKDKLAELIANKAEVKKVPTYHLYPNKVVQADVQAGKIKSSEGEDLSLSVNDGVKVNNAILMRITVLFIP